MTNPYERYQSNRLERKKAELTTYFGSSLQHQAAASASMLNIAGKLVSPDGPTPVTSQTIHDQARFYGDSFVRSQQVQLGQTNPIPQTEQPQITAQQKIDMGKETLKTLVPAVFSGSTHLAQSDRHWKKASQLEREVLAADEKNTLKRRNPVRFGKDEFYDAYEQPAEITQAFPKPLLTDQNNETEVYFNPGFQNAIERRYGQNPFGTQSIEAIRRGPIKEGMPRPIGFRSSTGWEYSPEHEKWLTQAP